MVGTIKVMEDDHETDMHIAQKTLEKTKKNLLRQISDIEDAKTKESMKLQGEITNLIEKSNDLRKRLENNIKNLEDEREKDGDLILKLNDDCERFRSRIKALEGEVEDLEIDLHSTKKEGKKKLESTRTELKRQLTFVENTHAEKHKAHENEKAKLKRNLEGT